MNNCHCDDWDYCPECMEIEVDRAEFEASLSGHVALAEKPSVLTFLEAKEWARRLIEE